MFIMTMAVGGLLDMARNITPPTALEAMLVPGNGLNMRTTIPRVPMRLVCLIFFFVTSPSLTTAQLLKVEGRVNKEQQEQWKQWQQLQQESYNDTPRQLARAV